MKRNFESKSFSYFSSIQSMHFTYFSSTIYWNKWCRIANCFCIWISTFYMRENRFWKITDLKRIWSWFEFSWFWVFNYVIWCFLFKSTRDLICLIVWFRNRTFESFISNVDCMIIDLNVLNVDVDVDVDVDVLKIKTRFVAKNDDAIVDTLTQKKKLHEYFHWWNHVIKQLNFVKRSKSWSFSNFFNFTFQ